ncbi:hypothetical protein [Enterococcus phage vB_OCPT_Ump]|nr:hypothetical protein [Enterococcus phage vB_OCPT_Ump]
MEDFVRKTRGVRDITSLPLDTSHELDIVSDVKGKIYIKILNRYKELLFDNGTEQWVIDMLNNLEVDVEQLKEDILDVEQALTELPMIEDNLETVETTLAQINTLFAQMQIDVQGLDLRTAELEREVIQLALKDQELLDKINNLDLPVDLDILYSNSNDFGDYDYSGNPNLMRVIKASEFRKQGDSDVLISDVEYNSIRLTSQTVNHLWVYSENNVPSLVSGKTYTMSAKVKIEEGSTGNIDQIIVSYRNANGGKTLLAATGEGIVVGKEIIIKGTSTVNYEITELSRFYLDIEVTGDINGSVIVSDIKIEYGSTATPYQPNLLDAPYCLSEIPLGNNIAPNTNLPVTTSSQLITQQELSSYLIKGEKYTVTLEGTKLANQEFSVFIADVGNTKFGDMTPVEGLTDQWKLTFTYNKDTQTSGTKQVRIYQKYPELDSCSIKWLKIEKGDTRTPNIPYYKYIGINLESSKNLNEYHWIPLAKSAETVDARLTKTISTYDTVNALQNNRLTALESKVVDTTWQNITLTNPFKSVTQPQVKKQNGIVYMRGTMSNGTGDCFTLPEGFRPPEGAYEMQFRLPCRSANASDYATIYVRPSGLCSIVGVNGTKPIFLSGIIFSTT